MLQHKVMLCYNIVAPRLERSGVDWRFLSFPSIQHLQTICIKLRELENLNNFRMPSDWSREQMKNNLKGMFYDPLQYLSYCSLIGCVLQLSLILLVAGLCLRQYKNESLVWGSNSFERGFLSDISFSPGFGRKLFLELRSKRTVPSLKLSLAFASNDWFHVSKLIVSRWQRANW